LYIEATVGFKGTWHSANLRQDAILISEGAAAMKPLTARAFRRFAVVA
jgi:hypothetical protein